MFKKIFFSLLFVLFVTAITLALYIFSIKEERPAEAVVESRLYEQHYLAAEVEARSWLQVIYQHYTLPSFSAAIGIDGKLVWAGAVGYADLETLSPADEHTQYRIGSISKSLTAVATLRLQEQGLLNIEDRFSTLVPDFSETKPEYTLKQLLNHQAGIRHYTSEMKENFRNTEFSSTREAAALVEHDPLLFKPGEDFHYSTYGYTILALALEQAANKSFEDIMKDQVFHPLKLSNTRFDHASTVSSNRAQNYLDIRGSLYEAPITNLSYKYAGGGFLSTPSDLVKFGNSLLSNTFLEEKSLELLWQPQPLADGSMNVQNYGLGFRIDNGEFGKLVHHGGKSVGGYAFFVIFPDSQTVVAFATNVTPTGSIFSREDEARKLANIFLHN